MTRDLSVKLDATTGVHAESWQPGPGAQVGVERLSAADLALTTDFAGIPPELRGPLAAVMVLLRRAGDRLSAALGALGRAVVVQARPGKAGPGAGILAALGHGAGNRASVGASWIQADAVQASGGGQR